VVTPLPWRPTTNADAWPQAISLGLDLRGGVYVEYSAEAPEGNDANFSDLLDATVSAIQSRLTDKGYAESTVQVLGTSGIRVEIPDVSDPSEILNLIGEPALLEFKDPDGNTFMTGSDVRLAQAAMTQDGQWAISFQLTSAGTKLFADMTSQNIGKTLGIYLDGEKLMAPTVQSAITGGSGQITGNFTMDRAQTIAAQIQSGALPLVLTQQKVDTESATLGDNALSTSVFAAIIGIALVMLIMIVRYRLNGVVASWALCIYTIVLFWVLAVFPGDLVHGPHSRDEAYHMCGQIAVMDAGRVLAHGPTKQVFADPRTVQGGRLTGCKNIFPARKVDDHTIFVPDWGVDLHPARMVEDGLVAMGVRAHSFRPEEVRNPLAVHCVGKMEEPFEWIIRMRAEGQTAGSPDLWWRVSKEIVPETMPTRLGVAPEQVLLFYE